MNFTYHVDIVYKLSIFQLLQTHIIIRGRLDDINYPEAFYKLLLQRSIVYRFAPCIGFKYLIYP